MSVRRLHPQELQPESFKLNSANLTWAKQQIKKFPKGREASAVIPILWRAQEQHEGWLPEPAIRYVADMLNMPYIRVLEVATFYTMFQLQPVGKKAHVQVCGTTPCMLRGSDDLIKVCKKRIAEQAHQLSENGDFSWEEVECLGACVNAPMVQIFKDTYEDLDGDTLEKLLDDLAAGNEIKPGPQNSRFSSEPEGGVTTLIDVQIKPKLKSKTSATPKVRKSPTKTTIAKKTVNSSKKSTESTSTTKLVSETTKSSNKKSTPDNAKTIPTDVEQLSGEAKPAKPTIRKEPRTGGKDDLKLISGVGPKLESVLNDLGVYHFDQISKWTASHIAWVDNYLKFKGRIERDNWIDQARVLANGGETEFSSRKNKPKDS